jgi:hypothetical protein
LDGADSYAASIKKCMLGVVTVLSVLRFSMAIFARTDLNKLTTKIHLPQLKPYGFNKTPHLDVKYPKMKRFPANG